MTSSKLPLFVIDARRSDPDSLNATLDAISTDAREIWVRCHEPLVSSARISRWQREETPSALVSAEVRTENSSRAIIFIEAGETTFPADGDSSVFRCRDISDSPAPSWRGWAYVPRRYLSSRSRRFTDKFVNGIIELEKTSAPPSIPTVVLSKKPALLLASADFDRLTGAVRFHVEENIANLQKDHFVYLLSPNESEGFTLRAFLGGQRSVTSLVPFDWKEGDEFQNRDAEKAFRELLKRIRPHVIQFHHFHGIPLSLVGLARKSCKNTSVSLHDHQVNQSEKFRVALRGTQKIVHSPYAKDFFVKELGLEEEEIEIHEVKCRLPASRTVQSRRRGEHVLGFVGSFDHDNGASALEVLVKRFAKSHPNLKWKVFGEIKENALALELDEKFGVEFFGPCSSDRLRRLLRSEDVEVALILPSRPELSPYAVIEARDAGCRVVVTNLGAPAETVKNENEGWLLGLDQLEHDFARIVDELVEGRSPNPIERSLSIRNTRNLNV